MRIRNLVVTTVPAKIWFAFVASYVLWLTACRIFNNLTLTKVNDWITAHAVGPAWFLDGVQVTALLYLSVYVPIVYLMGQWLVRPIFVRRWAVPMFLVGAAILDLSAAIWIAAGSALILGVTYLRIAKGIGYSLKFVPLWRRLAYAGAFVLMVWLMCGLTAEAQNYPGVISAYVLSAVPKQLIFGFWAPDIAMIAALAAVTIVSYVVGGHFFNHLTRHWVGPTVLLVFLVVLVPLDRYREILAITASHTAFFLHGFGWLLTGTFVYAIVSYFGDQCEDQGWRPYNHGFPTWYRMFPYPLGIESVPPLYPDLAIPEMTTDSNTEMID